MRKLLALLVALAFTGPHVGLAQAPAGDPELATGIRQAQEGEYDAAIITLDAVARRLRAARDKTKELAQAYLYLSVAYLGLDQESGARMAAEGALRTDPAIEVKPKDFPPKLVRFFDDVRKQVAAANAAKAAEPKPTPTPTAPPKTAAAQPGEPKKKGSKLPLILLGGAAVVGGGVAIAAASGGSSGSVTPPTTAPRPTPVPTPTPAQDRVELVALDPPAGSTISLSSGGVLLTATFSVAVAQPGVYTFGVGCRVLASSGGGCLWNTSTTNELYELTTAPQVFVFQMVQDENAPCPSPPFDILGFSVGVMRWPEHTTYYGYDVAAVIHVDP